MLQIEVVSNTTMMDNRSSGKFSFFMHFKVIAIGNSAGLLTIVAKIVPDSSVGDIADTFLPCFSNIVIYS